MPGKIELNLRARGFSLAEYLKMSSFLRKKKDFKEVQKKIGLKVCKALLKSFKESSIKPKVERVSFSKIIFTY